MFSQTLDPTKAKVAGQKAKSDTHISNLYRGILYFSIAVSYRTLFLEDTHVLLRCELPETVY